MSNFPFQRLQVDLAALIARTPAGQRLPSEPELAKQLGVSRATLREAMRAFETQGLIRRRQGSGTFVVGKMRGLLDNGLEVLESLETMAKRLGLEVSVSDLSVESLPADDDAATALGVPSGTPLTRVRRVVRADGRPVAYLVDILPEAILHVEDLPVDFHGSVLDFLLDRGDPLRTSRANVSAIGGTAEVAKALEIQRGDVLLHFYSQLFDEENRIVDYSLSYFIPGYFHFHIMRRVGA
ncbi:MAG: GntR family transcriptional regulator [Anaerolineales bacterium]|jgi:GntR family transcriptional regulator|uniref:GntR family transcriptional regulator n=1 Tax=Candidatus Villigracilis affinis TaxID=3140682 RepID=UPI001D4E2C72|nr:GntR family transcriptional regulator [Anaerolineales bacterium]MBK9601111.1 GntR family transcriptional regulator [Anaerolineales bacterium]MBL0347688.1 GntR family transcriptional regulator [Anaerolineales bacterium]